MRKQMFLIGLAIIILLGIVFIINIKLKPKPFQQKPFQQTLTTSEPSSSDIKKFLTQAQEYESNAKFVEAKDIYKKLIEEFPNSSEVGNWQKKIEELNIKLLFSPIVTPGSILYEVKPHDTLSKIASQFKTTVELIKKSNHLKSDKINPGQKLKIWTIPFKVVVDKSQNILLLKAQEEVIKTYIVATGKQNSTPVGTFKIVNKLVNPTWYKDNKAIPPGSPENILGTRWMGFDLKGYGIHGTNDPGSLGKQVTEGCIRMSNQDIEELYSILPLGTEVIIID